MEVVLVKNNVMKILCDKFDIEYVTSSVGKVTPLRDKVYWEGNPKPEEGKV